MSELLMNSADWVWAGLSLAADVMVKATVLLLAGCAVHLTFRWRRPALSQSAFYHGLLAALVLLPLVTLAFPPLRVPVLPARVIPPPVSPVLADIEAQEPAVPDGFDEWSAPAAALSHDVAWEPQPVDLFPVTDGAAPVRSEHTPEPTSAMAMETPTPQFNWAALLLGIYFAGFAILTVRLMVSLRAVARLRRTSRRSDEPTWTTAVQRWRRRLGITRPVEVAVSEACNVPVAFGAFRPMIVIPSSLVGGLGTEHCDSIVLHELAHVRRRDYAWQILLRVVQAVYWPNPLIWVFGRFLAAAREQACDDLCAYHESRPEAYRTALLQVARTLVHRPAFSLGIAMARSSRLGERLTRIDRGCRAANCLAAWPLRLAVAAGALMIAAIVGSAQLAERASAKEPADNSGMVDRENAATPWTVTLPNGHTVQLVAITRSSENRDDAWWSPDGTPLPAKLYDWNGTVDPSGQSFDFVIRHEDGEDEDITTQWEVGGETRSRQDKFIPPQLNWKPREDLQSRSFRIPRDQETATLRYGIAAGPWTTVLGLHGFGMADRRAGGDLSILGTEAGDDLFVVVTHHRTNVATRLIVKDKEGKSHVPKEKPRLFGSGTVSYEAVFERLSKADVETFELQTRPFQWAEFRNISLRPGQRSDAQAVGERAGMPPTGRVDPPSTHQPAAIAQLASGVTVEVIGVHREERPGGQAGAERPQPILPGWRPDGSVLDDPPYDSFEGGGFEKGKEDQVPYDFVVRVQGIAEDVEPVWEFRPGGRPHGGGSIYRDGERLSGFRVRTICLPKELATVALRLGVPVAPWQTFTTFKHYGFAGNDSEAIMITSEPHGPVTKHEGDTCIGITHSMTDRQTRVVAVDLAGKVHPSADSGTGRKGNLLAINGVFRNLAWDQIQEFRLETRPYEWVTFDNVSLRPGHHTSVKVVAAQGERTPRQAAPVLKPHAQVVVQVPEESSSKELGAWNLFRLTDVGEMLSPLVARMAPVVQPEARSQPMWKGEPQSTRIVLEILAEQHQGEEIVVGFFDDPIWSSPPRHARAFPGPGTYTLTDIPPGKYQLGLVMGMDTGPLPVAGWYTEQGRMRDPAPKYKGLGIHATWPRPVEVGANKESHVRAMVSPEIKRTGVQSIFDSELVAWIGNWKEATDPDRLVTVRTVDHQGRPEPCCKITFTERSGQRTLGWIGSGTDAKGLAYCDALTREFTVTAMRFSFDPRTLADVNEIRHYGQVYDPFDKPDITVTWDRWPAGPGKVTGRVHNQHGQPLTEYYMTIVRQEGDRLANGDYYAWRYHMPVVDPEGRYEVTDLAPGTYAVGIRAFDYPTHVWVSGVESEAPTFVISADSGAEAKLDIEVEARELLYGKALYSDGSPVYPATHTVYLTRDENRRQGPSPDYIGARMKENGAFRVALSREERERVVEFGDGLIEIRALIEDHRLIGLGQVRIDELSNDPDTPAVFRFPRPEEVQRASEPPGPQTSADTEEERAERAAENARPAAPTVIVAEHALLFEGKVENVKEPIGNLADAHGAVYVFIRPTILTNRG